MGFLYFKCCKEIVVGIRRVKIIWGKLLNFIRKVIEVKYKMFIFFGIMIVVFIMVWILYVIVLFILMIGGFYVISDVIVFILVYFVKLLYCINLIIYVFWNKRLRW